MGDIVYFKDGIAVTWNGFAWFNVWAVDSLDPDTWNNFNGFTHYGANDIGDAARIAYEWMNDKPEEVDA